MEQLAITLFLIINYTFYGGNSIDLNDIKLYEK
jgi:hypothetical protein